MRSANPKLNILAFFAVTLLVLAALVAFARYPSLFNHGREYRAVFHNVAGLNVGDQVRYGGLLVGTVTELEIDSTNLSLVEVRFRVKRRTPVRVDTRATITQVGFLGQPYLSLEPGSATAAALAPGGTVPSEESLNFQEAMNKLARFLDRSDTLFSGIERFADAKPFERVDRTLTRVEELVGSTAAGSQRLFTRLDSATYRVNRLLDHTDRMIASFDTTFRDAAPGLRDTQREALATLVEVRALVAEVRDGLNAGGGVDNVMRNLALATDNLARLSTRLERDPTSVLKRRREPDKPVGPGLRD